MSQGGAFMVVVGPDGAGKTTLARSIVESAGEKGRYFHFLPQGPDWLAGEVPREDIVVEKQRGGGSLVLGVLRIIRNLARAWLAYWRVIRPAVRSGRVVVGDRWLYGYVTQPGPLQFYGPAWLARLVVRAMPQPAVTIRITAPSDVVRERKQELTAAEIEREDLLLNTLVPDAVMVDGTLPPDDSARFILRRLAISPEYRRYPPLLGHVLLPGENRSLALAGSTLYTPARPRGQVAQRFGRSMLRLVGATWLGRARLGDIPLNPDLEDALMSFLSQHRIEPDGLALHTRTQGGRPGFVVLALADGRPVGFVRVGRRGNLDAECRALQLLEVAPPESLRVPRLIGRHELADLEFALHSCVLEGYHRPARRPDLGRIVADVKRCLEPMPRPEGTPPHWEPMHGDLTPWNLREDRSGVSLVDWESAGWGPPSADEVLYEATGLALRRRGAPGPLDEEAAAFWRERLSNADNPRDARLTRRLRALLDGARLAI